MSQASGTLMFTMLACFAGSYDDWPAMNAYQTARVLLYSMIPAAAYDLPD